VKRLEDWIARQADSGGDIRFWIVAGGYVLFWLLICVAISCGLSLLLDGSVFPTGGGSE
jgi:hypothetical protein